MTDTPKVAMGRPKKSDKAKPTRGPGRPKNPDAEKAKAMATAHANKVLPGYAKEINVRLEKAEQFLDKADDHRLAAAIQLNEAKKAVKAAGMNFKTWATENLSYGFENLRQLVRIGGADDPAKALADMRNKNKEANKKLRDKKASVEAKQIEAPVEPVAKGAGPQSNMTAAKEAFGDMTAKEKLVFVQWAAAEIGMMVSEAEVVAAPVVTLTPRRRRPSIVEGDGLDVPEGLQRA